MIDLFSLERVNKAPASFDPKKLLAFQERYMQQTPVARKAKMAWSFLQKAGLVSAPLAGEQMLSTRGASGREPADVLTKLIEAAGERLKVAGDILDYSDFFLADDQLTYDEQAFDKRIRKPPEAPILLRKFSSRLTALEQFDAATLEKTMQDFLQEEGAQIGQIIHALRVAVTGKAVGFGLFDALAILGKERCLARITRALGRL
jgi:glutamyl-tRNA synthetase